AQEAELKHDDALGFRGAAIKALHCQAVPYRNVAIVAGLSHTAVALLVNMHMRKLRLEQLKALGELRDSHVLTPEEFAAEKGLIMGTNSSAVGMGTETPTDVQQDSEVDTGSEVMDTSSDADELSRFGLIPRGPGTAASRAARSQFRL